MKKLTSAIIIIGLIAGTLDGLAATINYTVQGGKTPKIIFKYIASGALGKKALSGGTEMIILGVLFHFLIAFAFTIFFFWLYPKTKWLAQNKVIAGLQYGIFVWVVMNLLVVPLSHISKETINIPKARIEMGILMLCIGIPISVLANKHYLYKK